MREEPSPRQVLYSLVAGGFVVVVIVLSIGAAISGLVPGWWSLVLASLIVASTWWIAINWRRTGPVLVIAIALFVVWMVGTLLVAR